LARPASDDALSNSPTLSIAATAQGLILGTAGYMAPEQARGETVTKQADIWAFGCVLFEMLTGRQTWQGRSVTDIIASLVAREPDWSRLPEGLHPRVRFRARALPRQGPGRPVSRDRGRPRRDREGADRP
jgi:serine/threonine-protein kinase